MTKKKKQKISKESSNHYKAFNIHAKRKSRSRMKDESKTSKKVYSTLNENWIKNPNKSDIRGIDTKKPKAKSTKEAFFWIKSVESKLINTNPKGKRTFVKLIGKGNLAQKKARLQKIANIRYRNVQIKRRKNKKHPKDFSIIIKR